MSNDLFHAPPPPPPPPPPTIPPPPYPPYAMQSPTKVQNGQSITALVLGCTSLMFYWSLIVPALAIAFGASAISAQKRAGQKVNGMAVAGLVLGIVFLPIGLLFWISMM